MSAAFDMQSRLQQVLAPPRSAELLRSAVHPLADQDGKNPVEMAPTTEPVQRRTFSQVPARASDACPLTPQRCPFGGACHSSPLRVQAKLTVSQPGDKYEEEADRVADQVMSMPEPQVQRACPTCDEEETAQTKMLADQITPLVQRQAEEDEEEEEPVQTKALVQRQAEEEQEEEVPVQTKAAAHQRTAVPLGLSTQIQSLRGGGQPLTATTRAFFEPRFGYDFSGVRVHSDTQAAETARAVGARAYTLGRDIVFGAGEYSMGTGEGQRLLAHELTHVVQQLPSMSRLNSYGVRKDLVMGSAVERDIQRSCRQFGAPYSDTYCQTRAEAEARVTTACPPDRSCFIKRDGPTGYRWRDNPGYGCAHYVAHRLNIRSGGPGRRCYNGYSLTVPDLISGMTAHPLTQAQVGDVWATGHTHSGVVREVGSDTHPRSVRVDNCHTNGTVTSDWKNYGTVYR